MAYGMKGDNTLPAGRTRFGENNPTVHSKGMRNAARDGFKPSDPRNAAQPAPLYKDEVAPSAPSHSDKGRLPLGGIARQIGHATDGSGRFTRPEYGATTGKHGSDGIHDPSKSTDGASGQANSASGGEFGKPQQRPVAK